MKDFRTVTLTFNRGNEDVKNIIKKWCEITGKSKVDILADALRQYDPSKSIEKNTELPLFDRHDLKEVIREVLKEEMNNKENDESKIEENALNKLNKKTINQNFLNDDD